MIRKTASCEVTPTGACRADCLIWLVRVNRRLCSHFMYIIESIHGCFLQCFRPCCLPSTDTAFLPSMLPLMPPCCLQPANTLSSMLSSMLPPCCLLYCHRRFHRYPTMVFTQVSINVAPFPSIPRQRLHHCCNASINTPPWCFYPCRIRCHKASINTPACCFRSCCL